MDLGPRDALLSRALAAERRRHFARVSGARILVAAVACAGCFGFGYALDDAGWAAQLPYAAAYLGLGMLGYALVSIRPDLASQLRYSLLAVELPIFYLSQRAAITASAASGSGGQAAALFGLAGFLTVTFASALQLGRRLVIALAAFSLVLEALLLHQAGLRLTLWLLPAALLLGGAALAASLLVGRTERLVRQVSAVEVTRAAYGRSLSPAVALRLLESGAAPLAGTCEVTVLELGLREREPLGSLADPARLAHALDEYLGTLAPIVFRNGGALDQLSAERLLAFFGAPFGEPNHPRRAVDCALDLLDALERLNDARVRRDEAVLRVGIGVHTGLALVGELGPPDRREYTVYGPPVQLAAAVCAHTRQAGAPVLVSHEVRARTGEEFFWKALGALPTPDGELALFLPSR